MGREECKMEFICSSWWGKDALLGVLFMFWVGMRCDCLQCNGAKEREYPFFVLYLYSTLHLKLTISR